MPDVPDPADVPPEAEFRPPQEVTDPQAAQQPFPTPGDEHLVPAGDSDGGDADTEEV